ncbi:MAG: hypothetical protein KTR19_08920 [Hyphomicrobiales bacterium]|nr:hypothetical protein [Hyphomicrobiales bacterium]
MTDHFSVIGFKTASAEELADIVSKLPDSEAYSQPCGPGYYYRWQSDAGSELWVHLAKQIDGGSEQFSIVGVTPFFSGEGRVPVRIIKKRQRPADNAFEGAVFVEIEPGNKQHQCATVALLDLVNFAVWADRSGPFLAEAQIAAFPHQLTIFADEAAFDAAQAREEVKFAPESLFASGLFAQGEGEQGSMVFRDPNAEDFNAPAHAFVTGRVLSLVKRQNSVTGQSFYTTLIKTLGGTIDLVADESQISGELAPGAIIQGECWLCAKLSDTN